ncbi:cellulose synthase operon protein YhjQ [Crenobacter luteus]|nr:cellulose synthase operon protein YhjQ [Crenobacter luteus]
MLALDLCRRNLLRLHFGQDWSERDGWFGRLAAGDDWSEAAWRTPGGILFVPHGASAPDEVPAALYDARWLAGELERLALPAACRLLLDTPGVPGPARSQAMAAADRVLVVLAPEPVSCGLLRPLEVELRRHGIGPDRLLFVLNGFDPSRQLDRDVELLLRETLAERLAPLPVCRDEAVREALAMQQLLPDYAPYSQAVDDFLQLAAWLAVRLAAGTEGR